MKKLKSVIPYFVSILIITIIIACASDNNEIDNNIIDTRTSYSEKTTENLKYSYELIDEENNRKLSVLLEKNGNIYKNNFIYYDNKLKSKIFDLDYYFDNTNEDWKYGEQNKTIEFANEIKNLNLETKELDNLNYILDNSYLTIFSYVDENNYNKDLFSILANLKSAVSANIRMLNENKKIIEGTISPTFLIDKSFFIFQEDLHYNIDVLKLNIKDLENIAKSSDLLGDKKLVDFIKNTNKTTVRFDVLYSNYITKEDFKNHIENITLKKGDCKESCIIGCGTDWGCCGSYKGCCYFSSTACLIHDLQCTECIPPIDYPSWYCLPGCKPDGPDGNRAVKILIHKI